MERLLNSIWPEVTFMDGENQVTCPFHDDDRASAHVKWDGLSVLFHCKVCDEGKNIVTLVADYFKTDTTKAQKFIKAMTSSISIFDWKKYEVSLDATPAAKNLIGQFGVTDAVMKSLHLGFTGSGISFPITVNGNIVDVRTYMPNQTPKVTSMKGAVTGYLYPEIAFDKKTVVLVEGEKDMAVLRSHGINAATITGGAMRKPVFTPRWLDNKDIYIMYDNDKAGREGARGIARYILSREGINASVKIADISKITKNNKDDSTDFLMSGGTIDEIISKVLKSAVKMDLRALEEDHTPEDSAKEVILRDADKYIGQELTSVIQVAASFDSGFTIPHNAVLYDSKEEKSEIWAFDPKTNLPDLLNIVDNNNGDNGLKAALMPTSQPSYIELTASTDRRPVYKAVVASTTQDISETGQQQTEHVALVLDTPLESGKDYRINYQIIPDPKKGNKSIVLISKAVDLSTESQEFIITDEVKASLDSINGYTFEEIVESAKGIVNANFNSKLVTVVDLSFHSVLEYNFGRYKNIKGTIDSIIVSDTGFGKSVTSTALLKAYGVGSRVSLAGSAATPTGLIGGSKAIGNNYQTTAGVIPRNHKGLVFLEELAKNNGTIMKDLTDIRTSGKAEITRVSGKISLPANVRMGFFSNPKAGKDGINKSIDAYPNGVEVIQDLLGAREDIGRFDLITVLGQRENVEDDPTWEPGKTLSIEDMRNKLQWVWTRKVDQIEWAEGAEKYLFEKAQELNEKFESDIQIFGRKTWQKLSKTSIAVAAYQGKHTSDYSKIYVTSSEIDKAVELFEWLYASSTFRLDKFVKEERSFTKPDSGSTDVLKRIYATHNQIIDQLQQYSEVQTRELATVANLASDDFNQIISELTMHRFIRNIKGKIVPTEKFRRTAETVKATPLIPLTVEQEAINA